MAKLELGSGERPFQTENPEWIHNDMRDLPHIEIVGPAEDIDILTKQDYPEGFDELRAAHLLEHFSFLDTVGILQVWRSCLVPGGLLYLEVPNLLWQARALASGEISHSEAVYYIYGEQNYDGNFHKAGFTEYILHEKLKEAGFVDIQTQNIGQVVNSWGYNDNG